MERHGARAHRPGRARGLTIDIPPLLPVAGDPAGHDVALAASWRLRLKAPLARYELRAGYLPLLDEVMLEAQAGAGWLRLTHDLTPALAAGGRFRIECRVQPLGGAGVEWVALLRQEGRDQRFHGRPVTPPAGGGRIGLSVEVEPPAPGITYVLALSLAGFPAHVTVSAPGCTPLDGPSPPIAVPTDRAALARAAAPFLWPSCYAPAHGLSADAPFATLVEHLLDCAPADARPNPLFDPDWYRAELVRLGLAIPAPGEVAFLHWLRIGRSAGIVPTALFDAAEFRTLNPGMAAGGDTYDAYLAEGWRANFAPSQFFDARWYARTYALPATLPAIVHYATVGAATGCAPAPDIAALPPGGLDRLAAALRRREAALASGPLVAMVARAAAIEPQILLPAAPRRLVAAPHKHSMARPARAAARVADALGGDPAPTLILLSRLDAAGPLRMAELLQQAATAHFPGERCLLVATDAAASGPGLDLPGLLGPDRPDDLVPVLLDLVRGARVRRLLVIDSVAGWRLLVRHARQLGRWAALHAWLPAPALDDEAVDACLGHLAAAPVGDTSSADQWAARLCLTPAAAARRFPVLPLDDADRFVAAAAAMLAP